MSADVDDEGSNPNNQMSLLESAIKQDDGEFVEAALEGGYSRTELDQLLSRVLQARPPILLSS